MHVGVGNQFSEPPLALDSRDRIRVQPARMMQCFGSNRPRRRPFANQCGIDASERTERAPPVCAVTGMIRFPTTEGKLAENPASSVK
jgi:hypothetical protein